MRQHPIKIKIDWYEFQSTHPLRDATENRTSQNLTMLISIHAPLTGCDATKFILDGIVKTDFNPRTPYGMRQNFI